MSSSIWRPRLISSSAVAWAIAAEEECLVCRREKIRTLHRFGREDALAESVAGLGEQPAGDVHFVAPPGKKTGRP